MTFGKEFTQAVEMKQVAQQDAERARFNVEKAEQQKKAAIISAEGDSQVILFQIINCSPCGNYLLLRLKHFCLKVNCSISIFARKIGLFIPHCIN